jgi:hypothetical protein
MNTYILYAVIVIPNDNQIATQANQVVDQDRRYRLLRHRLWRLQHSEPRNPYVPSDWLASSGHVDPETDRLVVRLIKREWGEALVRTWGIWSSVERRGSDEFYIIQHDGHQTTKEISDPLTKILIPFLSKAAISWRMRWRHVSYTCGSRIVASGLITPAPPNLDERPAAWNLLSSSYRQYFYSWDWITGSFIPLGQSDMKQNGS